MINSVNNPEAEFQEEEDSAVERLSNAIICAIIYCTFSQISAHCLFRDPALPAHVLRDLHDQHTTQKLMCTLSQSS